MRSRARARPQVLRASAVPNQTNAQKCADRQERGRQSRAGGWSRSGRPDIPIEVIVGTRDGRAEVESEKETSRLK